MTIRELHQWAIENKAEDAEIVVCDHCGSSSTYVEAYINEYDGYTEVELIS